MFKGKWMQVVTWVATTCSWVILELWVVAGSLLSSHWSTPIPQCFNMVHLAEQRSEGYERMIERWEQLGRSEFQEANAEAKRFNCIMFRVFPGQIMGFSRRVFWSITFVVRRKTRAAHTLRTGWCSWVWFGCIDSPPGCICCCYRRSIDLSKWLESFK